MLIMFVRDQNYMEMFALMTSHEFISSIKVKRSSLLQADQTTKLIKSRSNDKACYKQIKRTTYPSIQANTSSAVDQS